MTWLGYAGVFAAFLVTHSLPLRPRIRAGLARLLGARGFGVVYSVLSVGMLAMLIHAAGRAPFVMLWPMQPWHAHATQSGMLLVCIILALSIGRPNPFSFGGVRNDRFDPDRPGIVRVLRHPILAALVLWAGVHLLPNGDLAHVLLFGTLGGFAVVGHRLIDRRKQREMGVETWTDLRDRTGRAPLVQPPLSWSVYILGLVTAGLIYIALSGLHPVVIGMPVG